MKEIPLTQGKVALVDDADFEWLSNSSWYAAKRPLAGNVQFYAMGYDSSFGKILMHRKILGCSEETKVDHWDSNGLNNQRYNLRVATNAQNCRNKSWNPHSSQFKGVSWNRRNRYWVSGIKVDYKLIHLGTFYEETDAAIAYNNAAKIHFGEFAKLNPIPEGWIYTPPRIKYQDGYGRNNKLKYDK